MEKETSSTECSSSREEKETETEKEEEEEEGEDLIEKVKKATEATEEGLTSEDAKARLKKYGPNKKIDSPFSSGSDLPPTVLVRRDENFVEIPFTKLVPGDVLQLGKLNDGSLDIGGAIVPADAVILTVKEEFTIEDESFFNPETFSVTKKRGDFLYASTQVKRGMATALVSATGRNTEWGKQASVAGEAMAVYTKAANGTSGSKKKSVTQLRYSEVKRRNQKKRCTLM